MTEQELSAYIQAIRPADEAAMEAARRRQAQLAKPPGSLGQLEEISIRLAGVTGQVCPAMGKCRVAVFAADNGVVAEGVSCTPPAVTLQQAVNMTFRKTGMSAMAAAFGDDVSVVDVGIDGDVPPVGVLDRKVRRGVTNRSAPRPDRSCCGRPASSSRSAHRVAPSMTVGTPTAITGTPRAARSTARRWLPTPEPGIRPVSLSCTVAHSRWRLRAARASMAMTAAGRMWAAAPCISSSVSSPVRASTPVHRAETGVNNCGLSSIQVGTHESNPSMDQCTDCQSYQKCQ